MRKIAVLMGALAGVCFAGAANAAILDSLVKEVPACSGPGTSSLEACLALDPPGVNGNEISRVGLSSVSDLGNGVASVAAPAGTEFFYVKYGGGNDVIRLYGNFVEKALAVFRYDDVPNSPQNFGSISSIVFMTPVPAALPLLLTAIGGLFGFRWLRRRKEDDRVAMA